MRVVLDTSALWDRDAMLRGRELGVDVVLPAVAFTERARQIQRAGRPLAELWSLLEQGQVDIEPFSHEHGLRIAAKLDDQTWHKHARDALIAGHVGPGDVLWTKNPKDFLAVGLDAAQIVGL